MTIGPIREVPVTTTVDYPSFGPIVLLICDCGRRVRYPGYPDGRPIERCAGCGQCWAVPVSDQ